MISLIRIATIGALAIALVFGLLGLGNKQVENVTAEEKYESVHIIPTQIDSESWENIELAKIQDLSEDSIFNDFNTTNSAYIVSEEYINTHSSVASASLPKSSSESSSDSNETTSSVPSNKVNIVPKEQETTSTAEGGVSPEAVAESESEPAPEEQEITPAPVTEDEVSSEAVAEPEPAPEPELVSEPELAPITAPAPAPEPAPVSEPASEPNAFYKFLENSIFTRAWAQEADAVSSSYDVFSSCDDENTKCPTKSIEFSGFGIADTLIEKPIKNIQLRFSLAGSKGNIKDAQAPGRILIEYFFKDEWSRSGEILITDEVSNSLNGGYFLYALPEIKSWEELDSLGIRLSVQYFGDLEMNIFLDGLWIQADADFGDSEVVVQDNIVEEGQDSEFDLDLISASDSFSSYEIPEFSFDYKRNTGILDLFGSFFMSLAGKGGVEISVIDQKTNLSPKIDNDGQNFKIEFQNSRFFVPGRHRIRMGISDNGSEYHQEQEFLWGALFINMEKISYRPGETARLYIEVLNDLGNPVCDTKIHAEIKSSLGRISTFSTENGNIYYYGKCLAGGGRTSAGFYLNYQIPPETGLSKIELKAETSNGLRTLSDSFEVVGLTPVEIIRDAPVNIVPGIEYGVSLSIKSDKDFDGILKEIVPANFEIIHSTDQDSPTSIKEDGYSRIISWPVSLKAGESYTIGYSFRALNSSLAMYAVGPASLESFREPRSWLMVSSGGNGPLILNDNSAHSCSVEPFSQKVFAGDSIRYDINLTSSEINKPFLISFPSLPTEIAVSLNRATGITEDIYADIFVQPDAPRGSFNLVMVYQEREDNGAILGTSCQFNIVVE